MPVKTILLPLCETDDPGPVLETAVGLARRFSAHLDIIYVLRNARHHLPLATLGLPKHLRETVLKAADHNIDTKAGTRTNYSSSTARRPGFRSSKIALSAASRPPGNRSWGKKTASLPCADGCPT
jgi:DNA-binding XRE family transcriptional regulator